jgi:cytochrome P450
LLQSNWQTKWYSTWGQPDAGPGFFAEQDPHLHAFLRKRVAQAYTMTSVIAMEKYIQNVLDLLLQRMHQHAGKVINFTKYTSMFAFDVVGELAYGEHLGLLANDEDKMGLMRMIFNGFYLMSNMGNFWGQMKWFNNVVTKTVMGMFLKPEDADPFKPFQDWTAERIHNRQKHPSERKDMLNHFLDMKTAEGGPVGFGEVNIEAQNIMFYPLS